MDKTTTQRGFARIDFKDANGEGCSLQESSAYGSEEEGALIWLGVDSVQPKFFSPDFNETPWVVDHTFPPGWSDVPLPEGEDRPAGRTVMLSGRMHLTQAQVRALLPHLKRFAKTGEL